MDESWSMLLAPIADKSSSCALGHPGSRSGAICRYQVDEMSACSSIKRPGVDAHRRAME